MKEKGKHLLRLLVLKLEICSRFLLPGTKEKIFLLSCSLSIMSCLFSLKSLSEYSGVVLVVRFVEIYKFVGSCRMNFGEGSPVKGSSVAQFVAFVVP